MAPLLARLEALLCAAGDAATIGALSRALGLATGEVEQGLEELQQHYLEGGHGLRVQRHGERVQLATAPEHAPTVARFLGIPERARLSPAVLETLAIIAYRQPVTRPEIERIRGVSCDHGLRVLLEHGLIEESGRLDGPGRPTLYSTTMTFLQTLGLGSPAELPPLADPA